MIAVTLPNRLNLAALLDSMLFSQPIRVATGLSSFFFCSTFFSADAARRFMRERVLTLTSMFCFFMAIDFFLFFWIACLVCGLNIFPPFPPAPVLARLARGSAVGGLFLSFSCFFLNSSFCFSRLPPPVAMRQPSCREPPTAEMFWRLMSTSLTLSGLHASHS